MHFTIKRMSINAVVAALYVALTMISYPIAFGMVQVRVAEALVLLCFFRKDYIVGLTLGCLIANCFSFSPFDILFGTMATLISCIGIAYMKNLLLASVIPVVVNGFVVGAELYFILEEPFWLSVGFVALGEAIAIIVLGYTMFMIFGRKKYFQNLISADQNLDFKW